MIKSMSIRNFTAFQKLDLLCSPGINVILGANSTGKSHLLKLAYSACVAGKSTDQKLDNRISAKLKGVFKPERGIGRLCRDENRDLQNESSGSQDTAKRAMVRIDFIDGGEIEFAFSSDMPDVVVTEQSIDDCSGVPVFIPPKEILSSFPGFSSLYTQRELTIDETYFDLSIALETPRLREAPSRLISNLISQMKDAMNGEFILQKQQRFYYKPNKGKLLEAELAAEGFRKLGILQRLLQNGRIKPGDSGPLFWDEPEANLNPKLMKTVVAILLDLAKAGQQVFLATHDYVLLKEFDLQTKEVDNVLFHSLYRVDETQLNGEETNEIRVNTKPNYLEIHPNAIDDTFADLIDRDIKQSMGGLGK